MVYETAEDDIVDEYSKEYLDHIADLEAEKADPLSEPMELRESIRVSGPYSELKQEE